MVYFGLFILQNKDKNDFPGETKDPQCKADPTYFLDALCKSLIRWHNIANHEEDHKVQEMGPGVLLPFEEVSKGDPDNGKWNQEQEYPAPSAAPPSQLGYKTSAGF